MKNSSEIVKTKMPSINMNNVVLVLMLICSMFLLPGCDKCKDVDCNNGTCNDGSCDCDYGYYGSSCQLGSSSSSSSNSSSSNSSSSSSGVPSACTTNVAGCDPSQYSCDASASCYGTYAACANSGTCPSGSSSSSSSSNGGSACTTNVAGCDASQYSCDASASCYATYADCYDSGTCPSGSSSSSSSNSSSSSSSSGGTTGQVTFYTTQDFSCGNITVSVNGGNAVIAQFYTSGVSGCGANGCATFTLNPGQYSFSASCSSRTWGPGSFTVTSGGCLLYELQ